MQLCIGAHGAEPALNYVTWQEHKKVAADLKPIYKEVTADEAERQLTEFATRWSKDPEIARMAGTVGPGNPPTQPVPQPVNAPNAKPAEGRPEDNSGP